VYFRGEYQQGGFLPSPSAAAQAAIAQADSTPTASAGPASNVSRFRLIEAYAAWTFKNNQISFGKQSLWWGPGLGNAMQFSDNAESIPMLRYDRVSPFKLPGFLGAIGTNARWTLPWPVVGATVCTLAEQNDPGTIRSRIG
jgi:hypothetical protein